MKISSTVTLSLRALRRNKMRTALTMLGIIIGVGAVIAMVAIGAGANMQVEAQIASLGKNVILVFAGSSSPGGVRSGMGGAPTLKPEDAFAIKREITGVEVLSPEVRTGSQISGNNQNWFSTILGESTDYFGLRQWPMVAGASFTEQDEKSCNKVAVIGQTVANQLFPNQDPVGEILRIKQVPFIIVGVLAPKGLSVIGTDQDDVVIVPYPSAMRRLMGTKFLKGINIQAADDQKIPQVQQQIVELLRQRHRIGPGKEDDFNVHNQEEIAEAATKTSRVMAVLLGAIASVSLLVGGIGIMNIMLVSVTERTREIGIRMAVGARGNDILLQFLIEAITLSSLGGIIGILLGVGASKLVSALQDWPTVISPGSIIGAFIFSAGVGVSFGFYPARKAASMDPIDALRYE